MKSHRRFFLIRLFHGLLNTWGNAPRTCKPLPFFFLQASYGWLPILQSQIPGAACNRRLPRDYGLQTTLSLQLTPKRNRMARLLFLKRFLQVPRNAASVLNPFQSPFSHLPPSLQIISKAISIICVKAVCLSSCVVCSCVIMWSLTVKMVKALTPALAAFKYRLVVSISAARIPIFAHFSVAVSSAL